ncbi:MAG: FlaD/FlaE family flagellar protein [Euryarchaeota archaeon]|nr:FlaD/FlaE family flagellar protein [Euryarchaeota archaeon]
MLGGLADKLKGLASGKSLAKRIGGIKQGNSAPDPFGASGSGSAPDADPFGAAPDSGMPDLGGFGGPGMPDMSGGFGDSGMPDFGGDSGAFDAPADAGFGAPQGGGGAAPAADSELSLENAEKITEVSSKLAKLDVSVSTIQRASDEMRETVNKLDESVLELLSLYEIVSNQVNPFVGEGEGDSETIERFDKVEKRINAIGESLVMMQNDFESVSQQTATSVSDETKAQLQSIDARFEVLAEAIDEMRGEIGNSTSEEIEAIVVAKIEEMMPEGVPAEAISDDDPDRGDSSDLVPITVNDNGIPGEIMDNFARLEHLDKSPMTAVVLLNWIEFLMERVGRNNLMDALDYYVDIEWIGEAVRDEMLAYARGIDYYVEKPTWRILPEDHTKSLIFIERLRGHKIDRNMLSTLEREMSKVKHGLEELYGI